MKKMTIEMPIVSKCTANECAYNLDSKCNARAITVGDAIHPNCDTYLAGSHHPNSAKHIAGIGACKTAGCKFNEDLECMAESIQIGKIKNEANCMSFTLR